VKVRVSLPLCLQADTKIPVPYWFRFSIVGYVVLNLTSDLGVKFQIGRQSLH